MSLPATVQRYLARRTVPGPWRIQGDDGRRFAGAVVLPALAESADLFHTLSSLAANPPELLQQFLILVVVNHRPDTPAAQQADNRRTLELLNRRCLCLRPLRLAWIDAASPGREMPVADGGVGLARKIGFDLVLERLAWGDREPLLAALDADTLVQADYLPALRGHFTRAAAGGAVLPFSHPLPTDAKQRQAMVLYELFLRSHVLGLSLAGSPYAFHTIGSTMACRAGSYVRCGGMNRRRAGEDFYFLQQLAKTDGVEHLSGTVVFPSARISERTPFGTGRSVAALCDPQGSSNLFHQPRAYTLLGDWLEHATRHWQDTGAAIQQWAGQRHPYLAQFLEQENFVAVWGRLSRNHATAAARRAAFHGWFDGLKTTRLLHYLAAGPWPRCGPERAVPELMNGIGLGAAAGAEEQLMQLRRLQAETGCNRRESHRPTTF